MTERLNVGRVWASADPNVSVLEPSASKYLLGWEAEVPTYQALNYLQYRVDTNLKALAERGVFEWGEDITYTLGSIAWDELDGVVYIAKVDVPDSDKAPSTNLDQWSKSSVQFSQEAFTLLQQDIDTHKARVDNPHRVTAAQAGTYTAAYLDGLLANIEAVQEAHATRTDNPHGTTAAQIGAVPITGGTYTGLVDFEAGLTELNKGSGPATTTVDARDGMFITLGSSALGILLVGTPIWRDNGTDYPLLYEEQFEALKETSEPDYAVPEPDFWMPLVADTNLYRGFGESSFVGNNGRTYVNKEGVSSVAGTDQDVYGVDGILCSGSQTLSVSTEGNLKGFSDFTIFLERVNPGTWLFEVPAQIGIGSSFWLFEQVRGIPSEVRKVTVTRKGSLVTLYGDGSVLGTLTESQLISGPSLSIAHNGDSTSYMKDLKIWSTALTPQQVATL